MVAAVPMVEVWRGGMLECSHLGHAVICDAGGIVESWGDPEAVIFPRSAFKMIQALPLVESGAAAAFGLTQAQLAFACASHRGAALHVAKAAEWLAGIGLGEADLRCGSHEPGDRAEMVRLIKTDQSPCQYHNNCSGKHSGFLTLNKHLGGHADYIEIDHPVQIAVKAAFEETTGEPTRGYGFDGCSAPSFTTSVHGLARAMAYFAAAPEGGSTRDRAAFQLTRAMAAYPELVAGEGACCTELMRAMGGRVTIKTGADGVYVAIIPEKKMGVALKIIDGGVRGQEAAIAGLLVRLGVLDADHQATRKRVNAVQKNCRGIETGIIKMAPGYI